MRRRKSGKLRYFLIAAALILALVVIIRLILPEPVDEHAGQVYIDDGFNLVWMTPWANVPVNPLRAEDFRLSGGFPVYIGKDYDTGIGIDLSEHQWEVDWQTASGAIDFAWIRLGYRGYTEGGLFLDPWYENNMSGAEAAGLDTGVYFFSQAINVGEAIQEAEFVLDHLRGYRVSLPVIFDWEPVEDEAARTNGLSESIMTDCAIAFCRTVENAGYDAGIYFNRRLGYYGFDLSRLTDYTFWVSVPGDYPDFYYAAEFWQYSFEGEVPGISGKIDMNMRFLPRAEA